MTVRPGGRWTWILSAVVTGAVIAVVVGSEVFGSLIRQSDAGIVTYYHPVAGIGVSGQDAVVTITPGPAGRVTVQRALSWAFGRPRLQVKWRGNKLMMNVAPCGAQFPGSMSCTIAITIQVPVNCAVRASTSSGDLELQGLAGDLRLRTSTGLITLTRVRSQVWARGGAGNVSATALSSAQVDAAVTSGYLGLQFARPPREVTAAADSGGVAITVPPDSGYRVTGSTSSGSRRVSPAMVDNRSPRIIRVTTASGSVTVKDS